MVEETGEPPPESGSTLDQALLGTSDGAYVELEGGCVCCQLSDELRDTLQMLRERVKPHRVIVETSGVALPSDTQLQFWREPVCQWIEDDIERSSIREMRHIF